MNRVLKYQLECWEAMMGSQVKKCHIYAPEGSEILTVQLQNNRPVVWVCAPVPKGLQNATHTKFTIYAVYSGDSIPDRELIGRYLTTIQYKGIVSHYFAG